MHEQDLAGHVQVVRAGGDADIDELQAGRYGSTVVATTRPPPDYVELQASEEIETDSGEQ